MTPIIGLCAKTHVTCTIVSADGQYRCYGSNFCLNPQTKCPREPGEGYEKCDTICQQVGHAEVVAALNSDGKMQGGTAYVTGHTRVCDPCKRTLWWVGVDLVVLGEPPAWPSKETP